jgi:hypothetical protein
MSTPYINIAELKKRFLDECISQELLGTPNVKLVGVSSRSKPLYYEIIFWLLYQHIMREFPRRELPEVLSGDREEFLLTTGSELYPFVIELLERAHIPHDLKENTFKNMLPNIMRVGVESSCSTFSSGFINLFVLALLKGHFKLALMLLCASSKHFPILYPCFLPANGTTETLEYSRTYFTSPYVMLFNERAKYPKHDTLDTMISVLIRLDARFKNPIFERVLFPNGNNLLLEAAASGLELLAGYLFGYCSYPSRTFVSCERNSIHSASEWLRSVFRANWDVRVDFISPCHALHVTRYPCKLLYPDEPLGDTAILDDLFSGTYAANFDFDLEL